MLFVAIDCCGWPPPSARVQNRPFPMEPQTMYRPSGLQIALTNVCVPKVSRVIESRSMS